MRRKTKPVPVFPTEDEELAYWQSHDSDEHVDWCQAVPVRLPKLKPSSTSIR